MREVSTCGSSSPDSISIWKTAVPASIPLTWLKEAYAVRPRRFILVAEKSVLRCRFPAWPCHGHQRDTPHRIHSVRLTRLNCIVSEEFLLYGDGSSLPVQSPS